MRAFKRCKALVVTLCVIAGLPGQLRAQTVLLRTIANTTTDFTYGNLSFGISGCSFIQMGATSSCSNDTTQIQAVFNGQGGTEFEIVSTVGSYSQSAGTANNNLSFKLTVSELPGSKGLSSITNILSASVNNSADNSLISSVLSNFNVATTPGSAVSNVGTLTTSASFALTPGPVSFNVAINMDSSGARPGDTLTFNNARLLFQPVSEPKSIAVLLTGLIGLAAIRGRYIRGPGER